MTDTDPRGISLSFREIVSRVHRGEMTEAEARVAMGYPACTGNGPYDLTIDYLVSKTTKAFASVDGGGI